MKYFIPIQGIAYLLILPVFARQPVKHPNILWISTEDLSPHLRCYGYKTAKTPNIDRLPSQGIRFTNVFTTAAISAPCRAGGTYSSPMTLGFYCPTHGASIVYTLGESNNSRWLLYSGPLHLKPGTHNIRFKEVRYGYSESEELKGTFEIK